MNEKISVIIPAFNEKENLQELHKELKDVLKKITAKLEIIFIDDGSTDGTVEILENTAAVDPNVKIIALARNYGQTAAIAAGLGRSTGDLIITMDADCQNDPNDIPLLLSEAARGFDVVSGWRKKRKDSFLFRRLPSVIANFIISLVTGVRLHDYGCTLKLYKKEFLKNFAIYGDMHRFLPAYCAWQGARITEVTVNHRPRIRGKSKYGIKRTFNVIMDLLVLKFLLSYLTKPIYVFGMISLISFLTGTAVNAFVIVRKIYYGGVWLSPLFFVGFSLWSLSIICILLGIVIEVLVRLYFESKGVSGVKESRLINL
ncbi:MAG: glycosyltransferase family 2 protein [Elusimicrobiota bacterium]